MFDARPYTNTKGSVSLLWVEEGTFGLLGECVNY